MRMAIRLIPVLMNEAQPLLTKAILSFSRRLCRARIKIEGFHWVYFSVADYFYHVGISHSRL